MRRLSLLCLTLLLILPGHRQTALAWVASPVDARMPMATDYNGRVIDAETNDPLVGANVIIENTAIGASTDIDGEFSIKRLDDGQYTLVIRYIGYVEQRVTITIADGAYERQTFALVPEVLSGGDVMVYGQAIGQVRAINQQRESDAIVNVVSQEKLRELPDVNAAEAIGRLPGVALQRSSGEGQRVIVRGLEPKFTNITINGVKVPSNSTNNKSVDLSLISSESLSGIEVYKSPTPDMDADAIGGTVNLVLREAPNSPTLSVKGSGAYNQLKSDWGNYLGSVNASRRFLDNKLGAIFQGSIEQVNRSSNRFGGGYDILDNITPSSFNLVDRVSIKDRAGMNLNTDFRLKRGKLAFYSYFAASSTEGDSRTQVFDPFNANVVRFNYSSSDNKDQLFSNMLSGQHDVEWLKVDWSLSTARIQNETPYANYLMFEDIEAYSHDPLIQMDVNFMNWADSAKADFSRARLREGDVSVSDQWERNNTAALNLEVPFLKESYFNGSFKFGGKIQSMTREYTASSLAETFYYLGSAEMRAAIDKWTESNDPLMMTPDGRIALTNFAGNDPYEIGEFLDGDFRMANPINRDFARRWFDVQYDILNEDRYGLVSDYAFDEEVEALYGMVKLNMGSWLRIITGARYERTYNDMTAVDSRLQQRYGAVGTINDTTQTREYEELMPHFHARISPTDWFDLRLSYAKTLARPDYNMVIPRRNINAERGTIVAGNPNLQHMVAENYDITATLFSSKMGLLSFSGFYKDLTNIFFPVQNFYLESDSIAAVWGFPTRKGYELDSYDNSPEATVYGYEIDLQTNLSALDNALKGVVLSMNLTKQFSETKKYTFVTQDSLIGIIRGRPVFQKFAVKQVRDIKIPGQTPLIFNFSLGYDYEGFSGRISGNYQSEYLTVPGQSPVQDQNNGSFWRWDLALRQRINANLLMHVSVANLNSMREETYRNYDYNYPGSINHYGAMFNFGFEWKL